MFEECVCNLQIVHYTEFDHFFYVNFNVGYLLIILVGKLLYFEFVLALKSPPMITASLFLNVLIIDDSFSWK